MHVYVNFGEIHAYVCEFLLTLCICMLILTYFIHIYVSLGETHAYLCEILLT